MARDGGAAGSITGDGNGVGLGYDMRQRLTTLTSTAGVTRYSYDASGQRVRKAGPVTGTVVYVYDRQGQLLGECDGTGRAIREYVWLGNTPVAVFTPQSATSAATVAPVVYFLHTDHLGAPRIAVDRSNQVRWSWLAEPFGTTAANVQPTAGLAPTEISLRLPGQLFDVESGLHYHYFRDYFPGAGRYVQSDPIGLAGGINTFTYGNGNPIGFVDPLGLDACHTILNLGIAVVQQCTPPPPPSPRPRDMTPREERYHDRFCTNSDDPCRSLKAATNTAIVEARSKMQEMQVDRMGLFRNAYSAPNPAAAGSGTTWQNHVNNLDGRIRSIWNMISLGRKMGCDMSFETTQALTLITPGAPK